MTWDAHDEREFKAQITAEAIPHIRKSLSYRLFMAADKMQVTKRAWGFEAEKLEARIEELERALAACRPVGQELCPWCWDTPPHKPGCPIGNLAAKKEQKCPVD